MCNEREENTQKLAPPNHKKLFIALPSKFKTKDELFKAREAAIERATEVVKEPMFVADLTSPKGASNLWITEHKLEVLEQCDIVFFASGWVTDPDCHILNTYAHAYLKQKGMRIIEEV